MGKYPFVKVSDMNLPANTVRMRDAKNWVSDHDVAALKAQPFPTGTVVFAKIGEALKQNRFRQIIQRTIIDNNMMGAIPRPERVDPLFFYYCLSQFDFTNIAQGTALPYLTMSALSKLRINIPPLREQRAIAYILGSFDDKIEINRQMSETHEAIARALFNSWFVDFDEIPEGWEYGSIGDLAEITSGKRPEARYPEASAIANIPLWGGNGPMAFVSSALFEKRILLTGRVGTLGSVFRITGPCWPSDNTLVLIPKNEESFEYLFLALHQIDFVSLNRGSTQPLLTQTDLKAQRLLIPPRNRLGAFHRFASDLYDRVERTENETLTARRLRDTLLPKLMSGVLRVKDAERVIAEG